MDRLGAIVARPRAREGREPATGFGQDDVGGGNIPIARICGHETEIDRALGDAHEAQRKGRNPLDRAQRSGVRCSRSISGFGPATRAPASSARAEAEIAALSRKAPPPRQAS